MIGITMGDPAGIGPEIIVKGWSAMSGHRVVYGDVQVLKHAAEQFAPALEVSVQGPTDDPKVLVVVPCGELPTPPQPGVLSPAAGAAGFQALEHAVGAALRGSLTAVVTAPIHKEAWSRAGIHYPGHTEYLAQQAGTEVAMILANDELAVALATVHCSMQQAIEQIRVGAVDAILPKAWAAAQALGFDTPRIAVAGLNPHAGEQGLFGDEEIQFIEPAIRRFNRPSVTGPYSGDTVFMRARQGEFDLVVAMTHDQGLIPVKYLGVERGVNFTAGLPFVRTSPDHGTAFEIAGTGQADPSAMVYAYDQALRILNRRSATP